LCSKISELISNRHKIVSRPKFITWLPVAVNVEQEIQQSWQTSAVAMRLLVAR